MRKYTKREIVAADKASVALAQVIHRHTPRCECHLCRAWLMLCEPGTRGTRTLACVEVPGYLNG